MTWEIKAIPFDLTYTLRKNVLWPERPIADVMVEGDKEASHLGAFFQGRHIGVISLFSHEQSLQFRKLAVAREYQGIGIGTALIRESAAFARAKGATMLWCDARIEAVVFYRKLGFSIDEQEFIKSGKRYKKAFMPLA